MLDQLIKAGRLSRKVSISSVSDFILKNELNIEKDLAILVAQQYTFREKLASKVPEWFRNQEVLGPGKISVEQSSSEFTAKYKAGLFKGKSGLDLTGGMGVDAYFLCRSFEKFIYNEASPELTELAEYNFDKLGIRNVSFENKDAVKLAENLDREFDLIYLDPARRDKDNKKVARIEDCEPNLIALKDTLLSKCNHLMVKFSPLLDIKAATKSLENITSIIILAEKNEVKELLFILTKEITSDPVIECINGKTSGLIQTFRFSYEEEKSANVSFKSPQTYFYEPNAAIMKGGAFRSISGKFGLHKISPNSHLYTSEDLKENFPGRTFKIEKVCGFDKKEILSHLKDKKANVSARNFPLKPEEIKNRLGLKDGGEHYLFFTQDINNKKIVIICKKITT